MNSLAPITLFTYNRPWHTQQTIEALLKNDLAKDSDLIIFSDSAKNEQAKSSVANVRAYLTSIKGFKQIRVIERKENFGLAKSIIEGVTQIVHEYDKIIVMEDDLSCSPFFLKFMNDALDCYQHEEKVISIHGYRYPIKAELPDSFFIKGADCLGWATWKAGWDLFESDGEKLLAELKESKLERKFDINGTYPYIRLLKRQINGKNDSWAVRWYASAFLKDKLTLYPGKSLIAHMGNDGLGTNFSNSKMLDIELAEKPVVVEKIDIEESTFALKEFERYFNSIRIYRAIDKIKNFLPKLRKPLAQ